MNLLVSLIDHPYAGLLAWSLVHFLWQGAMLALVLGLWLRWVKPAASTRYLAGVLTLAAMLAAPIATYSYLASRAAPPASPLAFVPAAGDTAMAAHVPAASSHRSDLAGSSAPLEPASRSGSLSAFVPTLQILVLVVWLAGVSTLSLRLLGGWIVARRLATRAVRPVAPEIQALARRVAGRLALDRIVRVVESSVVHVPVMVGWLKPVVLLPASAMSGLSPTQIEALLAHELAHVRRHDYLVNLLQSVVETLLFYHPAVWWVSRQVRTEREHCADDLAVGVCDRLVYVRALTDLAEMTAARGVALAATDGSLVRRVRRLLHVPDDDHSSGSSWMPIFVIVLLAGAAVPVVLASRDATPDPRPADQVAASVQGVPSGVGGGVAGGVSGVTPAIPGGVQGGVAGGLPVGIQGGAIAGVPSGVLGGVPGAVATNWLQGGVRSNDEARQLEEVARKRLLEAQQAMEKIQEERLTLEQEQVESELKARLAPLQTELELLRKQHARSKQMVDVGTLSPTELGAIEAQIATIEQRVNSMKAQQLLRAAEMALRRREITQMREYERLQMEYEKARAAAEGRQIKDVVEAEQARARVEEELRARGLRAEEMLLRSENTVRDQAAYENLIRKLQSESERSRDELAFVLASRMRDEQALTSSIEITAPNETIRPGDILTIEIAGEPDLPRTYVVQSDGTVRLPLVGTIRVQRLTTRQAREAVQKQLTDRRIEVRGVEVGLRRPREPHVERQ